MNRRQVVPFVALVLLASLGGYARPSVAQAATSPFIDISGSTFEADIEWLWAQGITVGCSETRYCPDDWVTRGQMASFLVRMFDLDDGWDIDAFTDDDGTTHEQDINRLAHAGITRGCTETTFCPGDPVRRDAMASFLVRAIPLLDGAGRNYFRDDDGTTHEADIDRLAAGGIASGCGVWRYCPAQSVTRGQMAGFLHRVDVPLTTELPYPAPSGVLTFYVAVDGIDTGNDCIVETSPCRTIRSGLTLTLDGDTIEVGPGTYPEEDLTIAHDMTIAGDPDGGTVIDASGGGRFRVFTIPAGRTVTLDRLTITGGRADRGGAISNLGFLSITDTTIIANRAAEGAGGIDSGSGGTLTVADVRVIGNHGGGMHVAGDLVIARSIVRDNTGTGIANWDGTVTITESTIHNNSFRGLLIGAGTITGSTISGNTAPDDVGGGIAAAYGPGILTIANSTISGNSAGGGSAITCNWCSLRIVNSTISGNTTTWGIANGALHDPGSNPANGIELFNSIVAGNRGPGGEANGTPASMSTSIVGVPDGLILADILDPAGLADNGGPTQTVALTDSAKNPAIDMGDAGTCAATPVNGVDQRGEPRTSPCDIGAYEVQP